MIINLISIILTAIGDILIGLSVLQVHTKLSKERRVDRKVIEEIKDEKQFVITGVIFIALGLILKIIYELFLL